MTPRPSLTRTAWRTAIVLSVACTLFFAGLTALITPPARAATAPATTPTAPAPTSPPGDAVPPPCGPRTVHRPIALPTSTTPAGPVLRRIAANPAAEPADTQRGRYTRIRAASSAADLTIGNCVSTVTAYVLEERVRDELTNSGRVTSTGRYADPTRPPALHTEWYKAGELTGTLPGRVPTDPRLLAAALDEAQPPDTSAFAARVRAFTTGAGLRARTGTENRAVAIADLVNSHHTNRAARQAILTVLADIPGMRSHGRVTVGGWTGLAVSIRTFQNTSTLVLFIDEATGQVRGSEDVLTDPAIGRNTNVDVPFSMDRTALAPQGLVASAAPGPRRGVAG